MKKLIIISVLSLILTSLQAQSTMDFGFNYGFNWNSLQDKKRFSALNFDFYFDFIPNYLKNNHWSYTSGISLLQKRFFLKDVMTNQVINKDNSGINYLKIPLMVNYGIPLGESSISLYLSGGVYGAFAFKATSKFFDADGKKQKANLFKDDYKNVFNRYDAGLKFSISIEIPATKTGLSFDYEYGLIDIIKNDQGKKLNHNTIFLTMKVIGISGKALELEL